MVNTTTVKNVAARSRRVDPSSRLPFRDPVDEQAENRFHFLGASIDCERFATKRETPTEM